MANLHELIDFGIITAPREHPTLSYSLVSLRKAFHCYVTIFAEPGRYCLEGWSINMLINSERKGALQNYDHALKWMLKYGKKPYICILEDDYIYNKSLVDRLNEIVSVGGDFGYYNLFTNSNNPILKTMKLPGWHKMDLGFSDAWGVAYVFQRVTVEKLIAHPTYIDYLTKLDRNIDAVVSETLKQIGLPMYYHNPSAVCSFGIVSTLGHNCNTDGLNFNID